MVDLSDNKTAHILMKSMSINEFCALHGISPSTYFKIAAAGEGPKTFKIGRRTLITERAAAEWLAKEESKGTSHV